MKNSDLGKVNSPSLEDTQVANRVKRKRVSNQNANKNNQFSKPILQPILNSMPFEKSPNSYSSKSKYWKLDSLENEKRFSSLKGSLLTGKLVNFEKYLDLSKCFKENNHEALFVFEKPDFYYGLMGEFYCNLESKTDSKENLELISTVTGQSFVLTELQICRALNLPTRMLDFPKLNSDSFSFNKIEFHKLLEFLSGNSVPQGQFEKEMLVSAEFLCPSAQLLALILRTNFLPRFGSEKLMSYAELKLIYHLLKQDLKLNISHLILSHMLDSIKSNIMVYGILLTAIFKYFQIPLSEHSYTSVNSFVHGRNIQPPTSLSESLIIDANSVEKIVAKIVVDESIHKLFKQLEAAFDKKNQDLRKMVESLENRLVEFKTEKQQSHDQAIANNSLLITTIGELQNKIYLLEQFYMNYSANNQRVVDNPNSGMERIHMLANECEMMENENKSSINLVGENGQTSQALGSSSSLPVDNLQFAPSAF